MVKPTPDQKIKLEQLRSIVLDLMQDMEIWNQIDTEGLEQISLGVLRRNATQRHGVTRWKKGVDVSNLIPSDVEEINIHPHLLDQNGMHMLLLFYIMSISMHLALESMIKDFDIWKNRGREVKRLSMGQSLLSF